MPPVTTTRRRPTWAERFETVFGPGVLAGITLGDWLSLLRDNRFRVSPRYLPRAAAITWSSVTNSLVRWLEERRHGAAIDAAEVPAPLFVLGHWRSGTTLLHDLLATDDRFACPNLYQVIYPHTFLSTEGVGSALLRLFAPKQRPQDNMKLDPAAPWEDEFAICVWSFMTSYLSWAFPRRADHYDRYLTFADASADEVALWRRTLTRYLKKLTLKHGKSLILKSPTHTGRIRLLLEMFPDARFVHIHREPYTVYQSCLHLYEAAMPMMRLQRTDGVDWEGRVIRQYREMHDALFAERDLIPPGRYHEVCFEDLEKDPAGQVRALYEALRLPDYAHVEPRLREYVASIASYRKNAYVDIDPATRQRIAGEWGRYFKAWGYAT
jgi:omega-hydroxy-beta-dihydromenaquinone-9 sulfotransferase